MNESPPTRRRLQRGASVAASVVPGADALTSGAAQAQASVGEAKRPPPSCTRTWITLVALAVFIATTIALRHAGLSSSKLMLLTLAAPAIVLIVLEAIFVRARPWPLPVVHPITPLGSSTASRLILKGVGLAVSIGALALAFWLFPVYRDGQIRALYKLVELVWLPFVVLTPFYIWFVDKRSQAPEGPHLVPDIWWYDDHWDIKGDRDGLASQDLYKEELQMMEENPYGTEALAAFALAGIDYGRLDFGVVDGRMCVYEINTYPTFFAPRAHPDSNRQDSIRLRWAKLLAAFHAIDNKDETAGLTDAAGWSVGALEAAHAVFPGLRSLRPKLSREQMRRGNLDAALQLANEVVSARPYDADAQVNLSRVLEMQNRIDDAIDALTRAVQIKPRSVKDRYRLADLLIETARFSEARSHLLEGLALDGRNCKGYLDLSRLCEKLGDMAGAVEAARRAAQFAPDTPEVAQRLAWLGSGGERSPQNWKQSRLGQFFRRFMPAKGR